MEEAPGSASRADVDPLAQSGHPKGGCENLQGPFQGSVCRPYGLYRGGKYPRLGGLTEQHDLEQGPPTGCRERLSGR